MPLSYCVGLFNEIGRGESYEFMQCSVCLLAVLNEQEGHIHVVAVNAALGVPYNCPALCRETLSKDFL